MTLRASAPTPSKIKRAWVTAHWQMALQWWVSKNFSIPLTPRLPNPQPFPLRHPQWILHENGQNVYTRQNLETLCTTTTGEEQTVSVKKTLWGAAFGCWNIQDKPVPGVGKIRFDDFGNFYLSIIMDLGAVVASTVGHKLKQQDSWYIVMFVPHDVFTFYVKNIP